MLLNALARLVLRATPGDGHHGVDRVLELKGLTASLWVDEKVWSDGRTGTATCCQWAVRFKEHNSTLHGVCIFTAHLKKEFLLERGRGGAVKI